MHKIHLRSIDLNLLVILHALLAERSVTRAATSLHLTQSATSHALTRLRDLFGDALLERRGSKMELTAFAETLQEPLQHIVDSVHHLISPEDIPLDEIKQTVHIGMADYPDAIFLPRLWSELQKIAPGINLVAHTWRDSNTHVEHLQRGDINVVLSTFSDLPQSINRVHLGNETYIGVARADHKISNNPLIEEWVSYPHVIVSSTGARKSPIDNQLEKLGLQRRVGLSVPGFLAVPSIVAASDIIALIPRSLAQHWPEAKTLRQFTVPVDVGSFSVDIAWHKRSEKDLAVQTVVNLTIDISREILDK